jgi:hypothetical protein
MFCDRLAASPTSGQPHRDRRYRPAHFRRSPRHAAAQESRRGWLAAAFLCRPSSAGGAHGPGQPQETPRGQQRRRAHGPRQPQRHTPAPAQAARQPPAPPQTAPARQQHRPAAAAPRLPSPANPAGSLPRPASGADGGPPATAADGPKPPPAPAPARQRRQRVSAEGPGCFFSWEGLRRTVAFVVRVGLLPRIAFGLGKSDNLTSAI